MQRNGSPGLRYIGWLEFELVAGRMMERLCRKDFDVVVGLPRGGLPVAVLVSHVMGVPLSTAPQGDGRGCLIVDDILDSGHAMRAAHKAHPRALRACLYGRPPAPGIVLGERLSAPAWLVFPWEFHPDIEKDRAAYVAAHAADQRSV